jgi:hypothetical protein
MNEDSPNGSPYEMLVKHDQSETKHDSGRAQECDLAHCEADRHTPVWPHARQTAWDAQVGGAVPYLSIHNRFSKNVKEVFCGT